MKSNEFKCVVCEGIFIKGKTDEEAEKEMKEIWGDITTEECCLVCDDCFALIGLGSN